MSSPASRTHPLHPDRAILIRRSIVVPRATREIHCSNCDGIDTIICEHVGTISANLEVPYPISFSFQPGDDADTLAQVVPDDRVKRQLLEGHIRQRCPNEFGSTSSNGQVYCDPAESSRKQAAVTNSHSKLKSSEMSTYLPRNLQEFDPLVRGDSSSSIVTAVRDDSGCSANNLQIEIPRSRSKFDCNCGSSEAVTAAKRALAFGKGNVSSDRKTGPGSPDGGSRPGESQVDSEMKKSRSYRSK